MDQFTKDDIVDLSDPVFEYGIELPNGELTWDTFQNHGVFSQVKFDKLNTEAERGRVIDIYFDHLIAIGAITAEDRKEKSTQTKFQIDFVRRARMTALTGVEMVPRG